MPDRWEKIGKLVCAVLAVLLVFQLGRMTFRRDALSNLKIPALPSLPAETNGSPASPSGPGGQPSMAAKGGSNAVKSGTNNVAQVTNKAPANIAGKVSTNESRHSAAEHPTNAVPVLAEKEVKTNSGKIAKASGTNVVSGTNVLASSGTNGSNNAKSANSARRGPGGMPPGAMAGMGGPGMPGGMSKAPELPLPVQARVFRITDSEILGPVIRPLPAALLGIVGDVAFIRSSTGQSGVVKEGDNVGALKLVKIGTNRVLVEEDGQKKELMIFSGYGGDTLMPKQKDSSQ